MRLVAALWFVSLTLAVLGVARAEASSVRLEPQVAFRFSAGSALFAAPGVGQDGSLYVGTGDGYLHALAPDGSFRWSYTVKGRIVAPAVEDPATGRVLVATSESRLYCFEPDARLRWVFTLPAPPKTDLVPSAKGTLFFVGRDDHLYGVTTNGALVLRLAAPQARSAPAITSDGRPALILNDSIATLKGYGFERAPLAARFAPSAGLWLSADRSVFACENGKPNAPGAWPELAAGPDCVGPPVPGDGFVAVPQVSGEVRLVYSSGEPLLVRLGALPQRPVWDGARRRLILSTATGNVSVVEVSE